MNVTMHSVPLTLSDEEILDALRLQCIVQPDPSRSLDAHLAAYAGASLEEVQRIALGESPVRGASGLYFEPVQIVVQPGAHEEGFEDIVIVDGNHRIAAAAAVGATYVRAFVRIDRGELEGTWLPTVVRLCQLIRFKKKKLYIKPPQAAKKYAKWGLEAREAAPKSKKGGLSTQEAGKQRIGSGVARARDIIAGKNVDAKQVKAFFDRHQSFYEAAKKRAKGDLKKAAPQEPSIQSWWLWGGDPMRKAAERAVKNAQ